MPDNLRLFFAVQFTTELQTALTNLIKILRQEKWGHRVRWVHPENLHLTLRFMGGSKVEQVPLLLQEVTAVLKETKAFSLQLTHLHLFPSLDKPHVISVGISPSSELFRLVEQLEAGVVAAGFVAEKRAFLPHITLGRVTHRPIVLEAEKYQLEIVDLPVTEIVLLNSEKVEYQQMYKIVQKFEFNQN